MAPKLRYIAAVGIIAFVVFVPYLAIRLHPVIGEKIPSIPALLGHAPPPPSNTEEPDELDFFDWNTRSQFRPVKQNVEGKSIDDLCRAFPKHLLRDIQPVIKTGHGVLETRLRPHLHSNSACLDDVLIFSDVDEEFDGFQIIDVIADLHPEFMRNNSQLADYLTQKALADQGLLQPGNSAHIQGWEQDKFKFLPSVSRAWQMRPEKRWYVFFEGDTFVVWDNLFRLLENFDPDLPWYFGSPSPAIEGSWMANGGPGYVLSREVVRRLVKDDFDDKGVSVGSALSRRWEDLILHDCCGDSVLGWAVHEDARTNLSGLWPMFNPHPLHGVPFSDLYWCQPVITMHKTRVEDMASLSRWEESRRDPSRPLLYADLAVYLNLKSVAARSDWDNSDWDGYSDDNPESPAHSSFDACGQACKIDEHCFQWTYHAKSCTFVRSFRLGSAKSAAPKSPASDEAADETTIEDVDPEDQRFMAGWDLDAIRRWMSAEGRDCKAVAWVRPSLKRVF
nr:glycoprotein-n-acetylgalactosamine 3-beta-galactosyltransferase 1 [Quercus suber]